MQYLIYTYGIGAFITLISSLWAMSTPYATQNEVRAMALGRATALGNFVGNIFALFVTSALWPILATYIVFKASKGK